MDENGLCFELPGFRFKPTEEELLSFYLKNMVYDKKMQLDIIGVLNIYKHDPWDLPGLAKIGEREWYFFVPRDRKPSNGGRPNRTTKHGFWKATGSDRKIISLSEPKRLIGLKKTLVFYKGRAPRGTRTDWVMNEYRLPDNCALHKDIVLCKVYRKATSMKELEERAAKEEAMEKPSTIVSSLTPPPCPTSPFSSSLSNGTTSITSDVFFSTNNNNVGQFEDFLTPNFMPNNDHNETLKIEAIDLKFEETFVSNPYCKVGLFNNNNNNNNNYSSKQIQEISGQPKNYLASHPFCDNNNNNNLNFNNNNNNTIINSKTNNNNNGIKLPFGKESLGELQVPKMGVDWAQDPILSLSLSPWIENLLNFSSPTLMSQFLSI